MLILNQVSIEKIWGGKRLQKYGAVDNGKLIGQIYTASAEHGLSNTIANGLYEGKTLEEVWNLNPKIFGWKKTKCFPLTIALVSAEENLSLQVHPDDNFAKSIEGDEFGKEESWVFLDAPESIIAGVKCEAKQVSEYIEANKWNEIYDTLPVEKGSYVHVEPGTLHALTAGSFVYEIQQASDRTYRFYDYGRLDQYGNSRELHLEKALRVLKPEKRLKSIPFRKGKEYQENTYSVWSMEVCNETLLSNAESVFQCFTVIEGSLSFDNYVCNQGQSFLLLPGETSQALGHASVIACMPR